MRRYYIVSQILLILPIIDVALAAPVLVQENRQAGVDVVHIPEDAATMLGKRGGDLDTLFLVLDDHLPNPEELSATRPSSSSPPSRPDHGGTGVEGPPPSIPEGWSPVSSPGHVPQGSESLTESGYELMKEDASPGPSSPASSTMSNVDHELVGAHALPNPGPLTESGHEPAEPEVHAPLSSPVFSEWFATDHGPMRPQPPQPISDHMLVAEEPGSPTEFGADHEYHVVPPPGSPTGLDTDHEYQVVHPPPPPQGSASPIEFDHEMVDVPPASQVSSTTPHHRSMGTDSPSENLQAVSDPLKGITKESRRISGTARDLLDAAQRELQRERSL